MKDIERLENTLNSGEVARYHTTPRIRPQTVAEHSWGVSLIFAWLEGQSCRLWHAVVHDCEEVFTGDIPAPMKDYLAGITPVVQNFENNIRRHKLLFGETPAPLPLQDCAALMLADKLEALRWTFKDSAPDAIPLNASISGRIREMLEAEAESLMPEVSERARALLKRWTRANPCGKGDL